MSGGVAYVLDLDERSVNREMVDLDPLEEEDRAFLLDVLRTARGGDRLGGRAALLADWPTLRSARFTKVMPTRLQAGDGRAAARAARGRRRRRRGDGGVAWLTPRASSPRRARPRRDARSTCASWTGARSTRRWTAAPLQRAGRPLHGLRHPVLPPTAARSATSSRSGTTWPGATTGARRRAAARDEQLPGVHRSAVPRAVRDRVRARDQRRPGDHQAGRGVDRRPGLGRGLGRAAAAGPR